VRRLEALQARLVDIADVDLGTGGKKGLGGGAIGTAVVSTGLVKSDPAEAYFPETAGATRGKTPISLKVNGKTYRVEAEHRDTLAEVLRDQLGLTGTTRMMKLQIRR